MEDILPWCCRGREICRCLDFNEEATKSRSKEIGTPCWDWEVEESTFTTENSGTHCTEKRRLERAPFLLGSWAPRSVPLQATFFVFDKEAGILYNKEASRLGFGGRGRVRNSLLEP
jgi:hypothetical protein